MELQFEISAQDMKNALTAIKAKEILANKKGRDLPTCEQLEYSLLVSRLLKKTSSDELGNVVKFLDNIKTDAQKVVNQLKKF